MKFFSSLLFCFQLWLSKQVSQFYFCLFGLAQSWQAELNSKPKSFHWRKSYSWHDSPQCRILLCLQNLSFGPILVWELPFNSRLEFLSVDTPETQPKQPLRITSAPFFNVSFYLACLICGPLLIVFLAMYSVIKGFSQWFLSGKQQKPTPNHLLLKKEYLEDLVKGGMSLFNL